MEKEPTIKREKQFQRVKNSTVSVIKCFSSKNPTQHIIKRSTKRSWVAKINIKIWKRNQIVTISTKSIDSKVLEKCQIKSIP